MFHQKSLRKRLVMKLITRSAWGARGPKRINSGSLTEKSTVHWNGPTITVKGKTTWSHDKCAALVRGIQNFHMDYRGWNDIAYNFVVCQHGYVFEGRGLNVRNGANGTNRGNKTSHAVMNLSGPENPFNDLEKKAIYEIVVYIAGKTGAPEEALGHRDWKSTECPGQARYNWVHIGMPLVNPPVLPKRFRIGDSGNHVDFARGLLNIVSKLTGVQKIPDKGPVDAQFIWAVAIFQDYCNKFILYTSKGKKKFGSGPPYDGILGPKTTTALAEWSKFVLDEKK